MMEGVMRMIDGAVNVVHDVDGKGGTESLFSPMKTEEYLACPGLQLPVVVIRWK
jgi:hypothetical protein